MSKRKTILIVTDGTEEVMKMARDIGAVLKGNKVLIKDASAFAGTDLLPADVFFVGCAKPSPPSFAYLEELLAHINLAGRSSGVFSPSSKKAAQYLSRMVKSSEAAVDSGPLFADNSAGLAAWTACVARNKK